LFGITSTSGDSDVRGNGNRCVVPAILVACGVLVATLAQSAAADAAPGLRCSGKRATIIGTENADVLRGTPHADVFVARGGSDRIFGRGGPDVICGGGGSDKLFGHSGDDILDGGKGTDACLQGLGGGEKRSCEGPSYALTLSASGDGLGTVSSLPQGINCGPDCSHEYAEAAEVSLTAVAAPGSSFAHWGGSCSGSDECTVRMSGALSVTVSFSANTIPVLPVEPVVEPLVLSVVRAGNGSGTVSSAPAGVNCGPVCVAGFTPASIVTLTALPNTGSVFAAWNGCDAELANVCTVMMNTARAVTASFTLLSHDVTLIRNGSGDGWVTSVPAGINCGLDCTASFEFGTALVLTATADVGSAFTGWSGGGCSGTGLCVVSVSGAMSVTATFIRPFNLTVNLTGAGAGTVASSPGGIACPSDCFEAYDIGTVVTLTATPEANTIFSGWSGAGCSGVGSCVVTMSAARTVTATFTKTFTLTVSTAGAGTVTSSPPGISCGLDCSQAYGEDTVVTLTATPNLLHLFVGWSGDCSGILIPTCLVTMSSARSVSATFL
jgi:Divergent InlB B-repeat domain/RTX calcium-binding nonapeptide repeat (4 copies)